MNVRLLRNTVKHMCSKKLVQMEYWFDKGPCGTVGCIAGTRCLMDRRPDEKDPFSYAATRFGLTIPQAESLFYVDNWPDELYARWYDAKLARARRSILRAAVEDFIATEGSSS